MKLIIAEKHSVAQAIAEAIGTATNMNGWIQTTDAIITWAQGHLVELAEPEAYINHA